MIYHSSILALKKIYSLQKVDITQGIWEMTQHSADKYSNSSKLDIKYYFNKGGHKVLTSASIKIMVGTEMTIRS